MLHLQEWILTAIDPATVHDRGYDPLLRNDVFPHLYMRDTVKKSLPGTLCLITVFVVEAQSMFACIQYDAVCPKFDCLALHYPQ